MARRRDRRGEGRDSAVFATTGDVVGGQATSDAETFFSSSLGFPSTAHERHSLDRSTGAMVASLSVRQEPRWPPRPTSFKARSISSSSRRCRSRPFTAGASASASSNSRKDALQIGQGSLYPAVYRLERKGLVTSEWSVTENNREAKYYRLTPAGRRALATELDDWRRFVGAVELVLVAKEVTP